MNYVISAKPGASDRQLVLILDSFLLGVLRLAATRSGLWQAFGCCLICNASSLWPSRTLFAITTASRPRLVKNVKQPRVVHMSLLYVTEQFATPAVAVVHEVQTRHVLRTASKLRLEQDL